MLDTYPRVLLQRRLFLARAEGALAAQGQFAARSDFPKAASWAAAGSVMGMVAYRGTPDDYAEWQALGAAGWGWDDVLPYSASSRTISISAATLHGKDGPVPIRRTTTDDWAPLSKAVHAFAQERQMPFIADMNADFRDGYGAVPMSNWPLKRASAAICYLDADVRRRAQSDHRHRRHGHRPGVRGASRHRRNGQDRRRGERIPRRAKSSLRSAASIRRHFSCARASGRRRHLRDLGIAVRADLPGVGAKPFQSRHHLHRPAAEARHAAVAKDPAASDDGVSLFLRPARRAGGRHVYQRAVQDVVEPARPPGRQSRADAAQADGARPRVAASRPIRRPIRASSSISPATSST